MDKVRFQKMVLLDFWGSWFCGNVLEPCEVLLSVCDNNAPL